MKATLKLCNMMDHLDVVFETKGAEPEVIKTLTQAGYRPNSYLNHTTVPHFKVATLTRKVHGVNRGKRGKRPEDFLFSREEVEPLVRAEEVRLRGLGIDAEITDPFNVVSGGVTYVDLNDI